MLMTESSGWWDDWFIKGLVFYFCVGFASLRLNRQTKYKKILSLPVMLDLKVLLFTI